MPSSRCSLRSAWAVLLLASGGSAAAEAATPGDLASLRVDFFAGEYDTVIGTEPGRIDGPSLEVWRRTQADSLAAVGRYGDALALLDEAIAKQPESIVLRWAAAEVAPYAGQPQRRDVLRSSVRERIRQQQWRYRLHGASLLVVAESAIADGVDPKTVIERFLSVAARRPDSAADAAVATGELALAKQDAALAAEQFRKAIDIDESRPDAYLGLARAIGSGPEFVAAVDAALEQNPRLTAAWRLQIAGLIDREDYAGAEELIDRVLAINKRHPLAWADRAVVAHLNADRDGERKALKAALSSWDRNPEVPYEIGRKLARRYRFAEAATYQAMALEFDPDNRPALLEQAQNQLRLTNEEAGWTLAKRVADADPYDVVAYNLTVLREEIADYTVLTAGRFRIRMEPREADLYGHRVVRLLEAAETDLAARYEVELPAVVSVDLFAKQRDFAIRTFGLPGGEGYLGVCFGPVVTMTSPAANRNKSASWESVLLHEFVHVVTLTKSVNRMPRWFSEGISVFEEQRADSRWGQSMTPQFAQLLTESITPLSELSGAFLAESKRPIQLAYYESSLAIEYLVRTYGFAVLPAMLDDLGRGLSMADTLQRHAAPAAELDSGYAAFVREQVAAYAPQVDFSPGLPPDADQSIVDAYLLEHPESYDALLQRAALQEVDGDQTARLQTLTELAALFAPSPPPPGLLAAIADTQSDLGRDADRLATLRRWTAIDATPLVAFRDLLVDAVARGSRDEAVSSAAAILAINPNLRQPYEVLAEAAIAEDRPDDAVASLQSLVTLGPADPAGLHLQIAILCHEVGRMADARRHTLLALEAAPRYRAAYDLLRRIPPANQEPTR